MRRSRSTCALLPSGVTEILISSCALTPEIAILALVPWPLNSSCAFLGGTPVRVNCPCPSVVVEMLVPVIFTVSDEVASVPKVLDVSRVLFALAVSRATIGADAPLTRRMMTAPDVPAPPADGAVGESDALLPQAAATWRR